MFLFKLEGPTTIIVFENLKFPKKNGNHLYIIGLRSGPLRADLMLAYSLGKFNSLLQLQLHVAISSLCRLPTTSRVDS